MRWRGLAGSGGATEVGLAVTVTALVVGALVGTGLVSTRLVTADGLTWLGDDERGEAVQVNPATGRPETRLQVAPAGDRLEIARQDGLLVVNDGTTGVVTLIDVAALASTGRRASAGSGPLKVLLDHTQLYLVDRARGIVQRVDPATAHDLGAAFEAGAAIADAALDGAGVLWLLRVDGRLRHLVWSVPGNVLIEAAPARRLTGASPRSVLVPHERGVTVFDPDGDAVIRAGTGNDLTLAAPALSDPILAAPQTVSPDLVPATVAGTTTVILATGDRVLTIDTASLGCAHPGRPAVHSGFVFVPCLGAGKVLRLDSDGRHRPPGITIPGGGDPELVIDDGRLIIHVPGSPIGVVVSPDGHTTTIHTHDESVPVQNPADKPPIVVPTPPRRSGQPGGSQPGDPAGQPPPTGAARTDPPTNVAATARADATVLVSWQPQGQPARYRLLRADTATAVATVPAGATSAVVTTLNPGDTVAIIVEADYNGTRVRSQPSNAVRVFTTPDAPGGVTIALVSEALTTLGIQLRWTAPADNGSPITAYQITLRSDRGFQDTRSSTALTSGTITVTCTTNCDGIRLDAQIRATNAAGTGPTGTATYSYTAPPPPVITYLQCDYIGNLRMICSLGLDGSGAIRWVINGSPRSAFDDQTVFMTGCANDTNVSVRVTVTNVSGSDSGTSSVFCGGLPR